MSDRRSYDDDLVLWLAGGERGISSDTIVMALTGLKMDRRFRAGYPSDPDDLRRCLLLLERVPALKGRFYEMQTVSPEWNGLTIYWAELTEMFEKECPGWRKEGYVGRAPKTYAKMKAVFALHGGPR